MSALRTLYRLSDRLERENLTRLHEPERYTAIVGSAPTPLYRRLKVYSINPAVSRMESGITTAQIPYEPLQPGPTGSVIEVVCKGEDGMDWSAADLEESFLLMNDGFPPSLANPKFHQQMVYAIAMMTYHRFTTALGRQIAWAFPPSEPQSDRTRLKLYPHSEEDNNAWYDRSRGAIYFGYYLAEKSTSVVKKDKGYVFSSVSHDVIAHEMSHALLDGLRSNFVVPTHRDVLAFHEAFADLVAFFQHFSFRNVVSIALGKYRGRIESANILVDIAREFGRGLDGNNGQSLRTLLDIKDKESESGEGEKETVLLKYCDVDDSPHQLGTVLARSIFDAYLIIYKRRTRRFIKISTGGSGRLPEGDLPEALKDELVSEAQKIAEQFLSICIRAIDYCPPVDIRFGDYLRALITADQDMVPDDNRWGYREAFVRAFGNRGIYGEGTQSMAEDELVWNKPRIAIPAVPEMNFGNIEFAGDPAMPVNRVAMKEQAKAIGEIICNEDFAAEFGIVSPLDNRFADGTYDQPVIESVRTSRRAGPQRGIMFDTIAEVTQCQYVRFNNNQTMRFYGGSTIIFDPNGNVRLVVRKRVDLEQRIEDQRSFVRSDTGSRLWNQTKAKITPMKEISKKMCNPDS